jgi:hypothetical protein
MPTTKTGASCVDDHNFFDLVVDHLFAAFSSLLVVVIALVRWIYVRDTQKIDGALAGIKEDHHKLIGMVNDINATRPLRQELTESVDELRKEVADEFTGLRSEIRNDINSFRGDMTSRLDTLIRMQSEKR